MTESLNIPPPPPPPAQIPVARCHSHPFLQHGEHGAAARTVAFKRTERRDVTTHERRIKVPSYEPDVGSGGGEVGVRDGAESGPTCGSGRVAFAQPLRQLGHLAANGLVAAHQSVFRDGVVLWSAEGPVVVLLGAERGTRHV